MYAVMVDTVCMMVGVIIVVIIAIFVKTIVRAIMVIVVRFLFLSMYATHEEQQRYHELTATHAGSPIALSVAVDPPGISRDRIWLSPPKP